MISRVFIVCFLLAATIAVITAFMYIFQDQAIYWKTILISVRFIAALLIIPLILGRIKRTKWEVVMHEQSKVRK